MHISYNHMMHLSYNHMMWDAYIPGNLRKYEGQVNKFFQLIIAINN